MFVLSVARGHDPAMMVGIENSAVVVKTFYYEIYIIARDAVIVFIIIYIKFFTAKFPLSKYVRGFNPRT